MLALARFAYRVDSPSTRSRDCGGSQQVIPSRRGRQSRAVPIETITLPFVREATSSKLKCISLFTGVGGLELGLRQWYRHVFQKDRFHCQI